MSEADLRVAMPVIARLGGSASCTCRAPGPIDAALARQPVPSGLFTRLLTGRRTLAITVHIWHLARKRRRIRRSL